MEVKEKTKIVELSDQRWQLRRMSPVDASYCWQRLMAAMFRSAAVAQQLSVNEIEDERIKEAVEKATPEERLRTTCGVGFMQLTYDELKFMQRVAMAAASRMENLAGVDTPMPVTAADGRWAIPGLEDDPALITQLMTEVLVFNLTSFLPGNAQKTAASS
jgi:hypothetical protein